jgi:hypothetical protein
MRTYPTLGRAMTARRVKLRLINPTSAALSPNVCPASCRRIGSKDLDPATPGDVKPLKGKHRSRLAPDGALCADYTVLAELPELVGGPTTTIPWDGDRMV